MLKIINFFLGIMTPEERDEHFCDFNYCFNPTDVGSLIFNSTLNVLKNKYKHEFENYNSFLEKNNFYIKYKDDAELLSTDRSKVLSLYKDATIVSSSSGEILMKIKTDSLEGLLVRLMSLDLRQKCLEELNKVIEESKIKAEILEREKDHQELNKALNYLKQEVYSLEHVEEQTPEICLKALEQHPDSYRYVRIVPNPDFETTLSNLKKKQLIMNSI